MDRYREIRDDLDRTCDQMDIKSATVHSNEYGKVYTIRFKYGRPNRGSNERSNQSNNIEHRTFVMSERSQYQMNRNRIRANLFKYRYQGRDNDNNIEIQRDCDNSAVSESNQGISPVTLDPYLSASHITDDSFVQSPGDVYTPSMHTPEHSVIQQAEPLNSAAASPSVFYAETLHLTPEECSDESSQINALPTVEELIVCSEAVVNDSIFENVISSQLSIKPPPESVSLKSLNIPITKAQKDSLSDNIELDYTLPRDQCRNTPPEIDLLCSVCCALPPAGSKLHICIKCNDILCGLCETLPSKCQHTMAGSTKPTTKGKPDPVFQKKQTVRKKPTLKTSMPPKPPLKTSMPLLPRVSRAYHPLNGNLTNPTSHRAERKPPETQKHNSLTFAPLVEPLMSLEEELAKLGLKLFPSTSDSNARPI